MGSAGKIELMPMVPSGFVNQTELAREVERAVRMLGPEVVRVRHSVGADTSGEPSIFFRIVITDSAAREETLADVTGHIATILFDELRPYENWGFTPYFSFRSQSEQAMRSDLAWS
jgi:hypothetical protein